MRLFLLTLALAMAATGARAETTACTTIGALPYVITSPGKYCLTANLAHTAVVGDEIGIFIQSTHDVELDCNDFRLTGTRTTPANQVTNDQYTAIYVGSSARVSVRHCRISGWSHGIQVHRAGNGLERSRDVEIEANHIEGSWKAILAFPEGDSRIRDNTITNALAYGLWLNAPPGQLRVTGNAVLSTGDTVNWVGQAANLRSDLGGWMIFENNLLAETSSPYIGPTGAAIDISLGGGIGISFNANQVYAPYSGARKGNVTQSINNAAAATCTQNLIIGYGGVLPANCTDPSNKSY